MCGIFGSFSLKGRQDRSALEKTVKKLLIHSESRGKEASGLALRTSSISRVLKYPFSASELIGRSEMKQMFDGIDWQSSFTSVIGHCRLVTNGAQHLNENNQPVFKDSNVLVHNGILVNVDRLWSDSGFAVKRSSDVDSEFLSAFIDQGRMSGKSIRQILQSLYAIVKGTASIAGFLRDESRAFLASNNGSLFYSIDRSAGVLLFASEWPILKKVLAGIDSFRGATTQQIKPNVGMLVDLETLEIDTFDLFEGSQKNVVPPLNREPPRLPIEMENLSRDWPFKYPARSIASSYEPHIDLDSIAAMRRCSKCILPETMPFINFDSYGVCNYCHRHQKLKQLPIDGLRKITESIKRQSKRPEFSDCIVAFSGGRDSSYSLHYLKKELKLNPIAYTYDWGMITDLGRRNQARLCGELGIEHILVSADIAKKRENIRKNVQAWLKRPHLGVIPLFMAGDKQFFYYANKLKKLYGFKKIIFSMNELENTDFKVGFCGIDRFKNKSEYWHLTWTQKLQMILFYVKEFLRNPGYINSSIFDSFSAYVSYYLIPTDFVQFFNFMPWNEKKIEDTLRDQYDWEFATDTNSSWRIGDGTAPFYNYIYFTVAGFTENDTFRSNQIREGLISRDEASRLANRDNLPRAESIRWYCETIGLNYEDCLRRIDSIPKLYQSKVASPDQVERSKKIVNQPR